MVVLVLVIEMVLILISILVLITKITSCLLIWLLNAILPMCGRCVIVIPYVHVSVLKL